MPRCAQGKGNSSERGEDASLDSLARANFDNPILVQHLRRFRQQNAAARSGLESPPRGLG